MGIKNMNLIFDLDDTIYNLMQPFEKTHRKMFAGKTDADCTKLFMKSRQYSDEIMEGEIRGEIPHEDCFYLRIMRTYRDVGINVSREESDVFEKLYREYQKKISVFDGIEDMFHICKEKKAEMAILTNGRQTPQYTKVQALGLSKWFADDHVFISGSIGFQKPDPEAFWYVEKKLGLKREETWYVGDTYPADVSGAKNAGWHAIWFNHRNWMCPDKKNRADYTVQNMKELTELIQNL
ncbi:MAG: HAD family hydrolase [Eubacterium sp.]|nr:HAD family hydrolase [Eubacterium sp.]MDD7210564.1 HAD family hydrolase [Lachnospiraceae bacterium]